MADPFDPLEIYMDEQAAQRAGIPIARAFAHDVRRGWQIFYRAGGTLAMALDSWYHRHFLFHSNPPTQRPRRPRPIDEDGDIPLDGPPEPPQPTGAYAGFALPIRGPIGLDTHLGIGRSSLPTAASVNTSRDVSQVLSDLVQKVQDHVNRMRSRSPAPKRLRQSDIREYMSTQVRRLRGAANRAMPHVRDFVEDMLHDMAHDQMHHGPHALPRPH